ncbi:MAG: DUF1003 domain-containing protein [Sphingomicrobium sp.]|nr:DUF1003 domain-containing protein [Sphingomonadales bacterium]
MSPRPPDTDPTASEAMVHDPTVPEPGPDGLASTLERNIDALADRRRRDEAGASAEDHVAEGITRFVGSMRFVYLHLLVFGAWLVFNLRLVPGIPAFDPNLFILATFASVEAIFLSTFVLISQNRAAQSADRRADLDLQISLLAEHEVTRLIHLVAQIARKLDVEGAHDPELDELTRNVAPEAVLERIEQTTAAPGS